MFSWIGSLLDGLIGLALWIVVLAVIVWAGWTVYRWTLQVEKLGDNAPKLPVFFMNEFTRARKLLW